MGRQFYSGVRRRFGVRLVGSSLACASLLLVLGASVSAPGADADEFPCGAPIDVTWSPDPVQPCELTSPLIDGVPLYTEPVPNPQGATPPPYPGHLAGIVGRYFVCDRQFPEATYFHPKGWHNNWWAYSVSDEHIWGWVPEVFFHGNEGDDEPDFGLRSCGLPPNTVPPPSPVPPADRCDLSPTDPTERLFASVRRKGDKGHHKAVTVTYGRRVHVSGRLLQKGRVPVPNATVCVNSKRSVPGARASETTVTTDDHGRFSYTLQRGPSRSLTFVHRTGQGAASATVKVNVRAKLRLRAQPKSLRNGESVKLRGRQIGRPSRSGVVVELQARRGPRWITFATTKTKKSGRFSYKYRFTRTVGVHVYKLRAYQPSQRGSPFAAGASRFVRVKVSG
jgi:hypothetical protein